MIPVFSSAALATKSDATKTVAGSPKPARLWFSVSTPVTQSASAQPTQTATTGSRSQMKSPITPAMMANTIQISVMSPRPMAFPGPQNPGAGHPGGRNSSYA